MLHNIEMVFYLRDAGFYVTTAFITITFQYPTFRNKHSTFFFTFLDGFQVHGCCVFIDQWAYMIFFIQWVADPELFVGINEFFFYMFVNVLMDDQSSRGSATLARRTDSTEQGAQNGN